MFLKALIVLFFFINSFLNLQASEKKSIINYFSNINNFSFNFEQVTKEKIEMGNCVLEFNDKLRCIYNDKMQKEIIIKNKTLVVLQKRYDKIFYYPVSKSPFVNILNKKKFINLIKKSDLILNDNIELVYLDKNQKKITVFFEKKNFTLIGWLIEDDFQNQIYFSLQITKTNSEIDEDYFKIPVIN